MGFVGDLLTGYASDSIKSLLKPVIDRIGLVVNSLWGFEADLGDLREKLQKLDDMLSGVEPGSFGDNRVLDRWWQRARQVAYQAEDVIDECSYELLKRRLASRSPSCYNLSSNPARDGANVGSRGIKRPRFNPETDLSYVMFKQQMAREIKSLKESINEIYVEARKLGINPVEVARGRSYAYCDYQNDHNATAMSLQRQMPYNEVLIKREGAEDDIIGWLREASDSDKHLSVVGICGMAGVGKTTICESIFNTMKIKEVFEERIWICISHDCDFIQMLNHMIEKIEDKQSSQTRDVHILKERLEEKMQRKKFLLVLDDIWGTFERHWDALRGCLQNVGALKGNTILATSRLRDVLEKLHASRILPLEKLSEEDSRSLFKQCVGENNLLDPTKAHLGWKMLSKCEGVPLAIKALGGLLKSQNSTSQWRKIEQDGNIWNKVDDILPSVKLSFKYLPSIAVKKCFAYCAIFKEDEIFEKDRLIQLWMAQGLLCDEPLGEEYFHILLNYSLFQDAGFDNSGKVRDYRMHDVVHSLAVNISEGDTEITGRRSLHLIGGSFDITQEEFTKCLRVLSLISVGLKELPDSIGELKHLRYLDISWNRINRLPNGLGELYHLQTLRIHSQTMPMLPKEFSKLANLRHLCGGRYCTMEIPVDLGMLTSLQTLPAIDLDKHSWGGRASELGNLHNLTGELKLVGFRDAGIIEDLKKVKLGTKEKIERLTLYFNSRFNVNKKDVNHVRMLEALQPHSNLGALEISDYQSKALPKWMMEMIGHGDTPLQNLVSLSINRCRVLKQQPSMKNLTSLQRLRMLECFEMETLPDNDIQSLVCLEYLWIWKCRKMSCLPVGSNLPNLKTLKIGWLSPHVSIFPFPDLDDHSPLSASLRELEMDASGMDKVENLPDQIQHLRQLRSLKILHFSNLEELPEWLGRLTSLETLTFEGLPLVEDLPSQDAMKSLSRLTKLDVCRCPLLEASCHTPNGSDWMKIQNIRHVSIPRTFRGLGGHVVMGFVRESTNSLLKAVIGGISQEVNSLWGFKAGLGDLGVKLQKLDDMLFGVEPGSWGNNRVPNRLMKRAREVAYQAEDVIDEYSYELQKRTIASLSSNPAAFRQQMAHKIKSLEESINEIYVEAYKQGIDPAEVADGRSSASCDDQDDDSATAMSLQRQMPHNEELIGRKLKEDDIIEWLREASNSDKHLSVVGICGPEGIGKTTLCESIFNTMEIKEGFEERIWICDSHDYDFNFIRLLNRMSGQIGDQQPSNIDDLDILKERLEEKMQRKKFLLVLDNIWDRSGQYRDALLEHLQNVGALKGNTILAISPHPRYLFTYSDTFFFVRSLSGEDSGPLFKQCVGENNLSDPTKADLGWKMLSKCEGVPLAIKALGGLLKSQNSTSQWRKIKEDGDIWHRSGVNDVWAFVKLSFKYLPSVAVKKCFAYCAIFKTGEAIERDRLIQLWMAQGLLQSYDEKEQLCDEALGEEYLRILLNYSLFQVARFDDLGNIRSCKMHGGVHSLALDISKGDIKIIECRSLHLQEGWSSKLSNGSIASFDITRKEEFITKTKCLRVLSLVRVGLEGLPDWIEELKHLRYLDISENKIRCLPTGLGKLYHLQTLRIFDNVVPDGGFRMPMLPKEFTKLANLRHFCSNLGMEMPVDLGMLTSLQTLPAMELDRHSRGGRASELGNLHNLTGELKLVGFRDAGIIEDLKKVKLGTKERIEKLVLTFHSNSATPENMNGEDVNHVMMLEALQPHSKLAALAISGYRSKALPKWTMEMIGHQDTPLQNLVSLSIERCPLLEQLPSMKNLSALKVLSIGNCERATALQNLEYLTSLRSLQLCFCSEMENLPDIRSLVCLEELRIKACRKMTCLPAGLSNLPNFKTLEISELSPNVSSFPFPDLNHRSPLSASLRELHMGASRMDKVENLPNQIQHLHQLRFLRIECFENLKELPEWLGKLTSLEALRLEELPLVEHLPSQAAMECLSQLTVLKVSHCRLLEQSCRTPNGSDWVKIQKIHHVIFWPA